MFKRIVILSLLACMTSGCVKEDTGECAPGLRLYFRYTYNNMGQDQLASRIGDIRIYLFDQSTGLLTDIIRAERQDIDRGWMEPSISKGVYTVVAWAADGEDMMQGGYHDAEMINPATHTFIPQARIGVTTLDNFRMVLTSDALPAGSIGEITPSTEDFDHLFFAIAANVSIANKNGQVVELDFIKNTSILKVKVTGLEHLTRAPAADQPLSVFVTGRNERGGYNNAIGSHAREVRYEPPCKTLTVTTANFDIKVQRLDIAYHIAHPVLLYVRNQHDGQDVIVPLDVMDAILQAEDAQGNPIWQTQEAIDREDEFPIEISILHDLNVRVTVNGFEIVDTTPDIDRN